MIGKQTLQPFQIACLRRNMPWPAHVLVLLALGGCSMPPQHPARAIPPQQALLAQYNNSIAKSAIFQPAAIKPLKPVEGACPAVVTWMPERFSRPLVRDQVLDFNRAQWVSVEGELRAKCASVRSDATGLRLRLQQYLGLPPAQEERQFVILQVRAADLFRPCLDSDIRKPTCDRNNYPAQENSQHERWMLRQILGSYNMGENGAAAGYPWTGLGYTYDWGSENDAYGVSEYVLQPGAKAKVLDVVSTEQYCNVAYRPRAVIGEYCAVQRP